MNRKKIMLLLAVFPIILFAGSIQYTFRFSLSDLTFSEYNGYDVVKIKDGVANTEVGKPSIPFIVANFVIPPDAEVVDVAVVEKKTQEIPGTYNICPVQTPRPISYKGDVPFVEPAPDVYSSSNPYPEKDIVSFPSGSMSGFRIAGIFVNPMKYIPKEKKLILTTELTVKVQYREGVYNPIRLTEKQREVFSQGVELIVVNHNDIARFSPPVKREPPRACNYAIITNSTLQSAWQRLANWKIAAGYTAQVFTTDWIYSNYTGYDNQEKIRNFLKDYFQNQGLIYAVLGGDNNIVPERDAYCSYYDPYYLASDYYYSDLDGTWDGNGNHLYGEVTGDNVDGYFDIYVGRPPVDDATEINYFLNKDSTYIYNPPSSYIQKILLPSVMLFSQYNYHGRVVNNAIGDMFPGWTVTKIEDQTAPATRNAFNQNYNLMHIAAHGDQNGTYTEYGSPVFTSSDIPYLTNTMPTILNSIACYSGDFDEYNDCFAEALVTDDYGCVATIMNSRYGWGTPPSMGPSEQMDTCFYSVVHKDTFHIGILHGASKNHYRNLIWNASQEPWHYCGVELNLFGDPEMSVRLAPANQPYIYIASKTLNDQNGNGVWDPGEYAELITTLSNGGSVNATNVNAVLRATTNSQYVTITDSTSYFGNIAVGGSASNSSDPFKMTAAPNTPDGTEIGFTLHITADGGYYWDQTFTLTVGTPGLDFVTHNCGNCQFTVTRYGALGFMGSNQASGVGFIYPSSDSNYLYYGGFAAGTNSSYCVDRYYESNQQDDDDWNTTTNPDGKCRMYEPGPYGWDEYVTARYDDSGHPSPKGLVCDQYSWAWDDATANDFVIMKFVLTNNGSTTISNLYFAVFMDWDITALYDANYGNSESARNLTYMYYTASYPYVGVEILDPPRTTPAKNLAIINNPTYVWPYYGLPDNIQIQFMDGTIQNPSGTTADDWSTCNSSGPFTLAPGQSTVVAFAILGGTNLTDLQANADTAYNRYWNWPGIKEEGRKVVTNRLSIYPVVSKGRLNLAYTDYQNEKIVMGLYDIVGRKVMEKAWSNLSGTGLLKMDLAHLPNGVYFVRIENEHENPMVEKIILLK